MRILAFNGSPRKKGNTSAIIRAILNGAASEGAETVEVRLHDIDMKGCQGCLACRQKPGVCAQRDDLSPHLESMKTCQGIVFGCPIYMYHVSGQMKQLVDRLYSFWANNPDGSYYSAPYRYIEQSLEAHVSEHLVELYAGLELVATHVRNTRPGQWQTRLEDYPPAKAAYLIQTPAYCCREATRIGQATRQVVDQLLAERPLERLRAVQAILGLEKSVGPVRLEAACARALFYGDVRYRRIKEILNAALDRDPLPEPPMPPAEPPQPFTFARSSGDFFPPEPEGQLC